VAFNVSLEKATEIHEVEMRSVTRHDVVPRCVYSVSEKLKTHLTIAFIVRNALLMWWR